MKHTRKGSWPSSSVPACLRTSRGLELGCWMFGCWLCWHHALVEISTAIAALDDVPFPCFVHRSGSACCPVTHTPAILTTGCDRSAAHTPCGRHGAMAGQVLAAGGRPDTGGGGPCWVCVTGRWQVVAGGVRHMLWGGVRHML